MIKILLTSTLTAISSYILLVPLAHADYACFKPYQAASFEYKAFPSGRWSWFHNTNNFSYHQRPGVDIWRKDSDQSNTVGAMCKNGSGLDYKRDYDGLQDACGIQHASVPSQSYAPTCFGSRHNIFNPETGYCSSGNDIGVVPIGGPSLVYSDDGQNSHEYCPDGGTIRYSESGKPRVSGADLLNEMSSAKLSCPSAERYGQKTLTAATRKQDNFAHYEFFVPKNTSAAYLSFSAKPSTSNTDPYMKVDHIFQIVGDENADSFNRPFQYKSATIGFTERSYKPADRHMALVQRRWDSDVVPNYVRLGIALDTISPVQGASDTSTRILALFEDKIGSNYRYQGKTDVEQIKLEWCAEFSLSAGTFESVADKGLASVAIDTGSPDGSVYQSSEIAVGSSVNSTPSAQQPRVTATPVPARSLQRQQLEKKAQPTEVVKPATRAEPKE